MNDPLVVGYVLPLLAAAIAIFIILWLFFALTASYGTFAEESSQALDRWLELQGVTVLSTKLRGGGPYHKIRVRDNLGQVYSGWAHVRAVQDRLKKVDPLRRDSTGDLPSFLGPLASGYKITLEWERQAPFGVPLKGEILRHQYESADDLRDVIDK